MTFYLGTHKPGWLATAGVPLMVSHRRLRERTRLPVAVAPWILDSGGFSELSRFGRWTISPAEYLEAIERYSSEVGSLVWAAPQDHMCEPAILAQTGRTVAEHQASTIESVLELRREGAPVIAVLQGFELGEYLDHVEQYADAGVELELEEVVGLGSICRRQGSDAVATILAELTPIRLHGFGVKVLGRRHGFASTDSAAWSLNARRRSGPCPVGSARNCANCLHYALAWRERHELEEAA